MSECSWRGSSPCSGPPIARAPFQCSVCGVNVVALCEGHLRLWQTVVLGCDHHPCTIVRGEPVAL